MLKRTALLAALVVAAPAAAHGPLDAVRVRLDRVEPAATGVVVQVFDDHLAPQLVIANRGSLPLEVLDPKGRPFLRIGPRGVEADVAAPEFQRTLSPSGQPPPGFQPRDASDWRLIRSEPSWGWFDSRLDKTRLMPSFRLELLDTPADIAHWRVPARLDGKPLAIEGRFRFEPRPAGAWRAFLDGPDAPLPQTRVTLSPGTPPALLVENSHREPLIVLGSQGEPFLRIGASGVEANVASPTWQDQGRYTGLTMEPAKGPEQWKRVSSAPRYAWVEPRIREGEWRVPIRRGATEAVIAGRMEWVAAPAP